MVQEQKKQDGSQISKDDVHNLLKSNTPTAKIAVLNKITAVYNKARIGGEPSDKEIALIEDIFRTLVKNAEKEVRIAFSQSIHNSINLPKDIALSLAKDIDEVAIPILESSQVLNDDDLLQIIGNTENTQQLLAIARRVYVPKDISAALLEKNEDVAETLLKNFGAEMSEETYSRIIEKSFDSDVIVKAMVEKGTMPVTVLEKLLKHVSGNIRDQLDKKYQVVFEDNDLKKEMQQNLQQATVRMMGLRSADTKRSEFLTKLSAEGKLPPFVALTTGDLTSFEVTMARLCRVSLNNARILINDQGDLGFKKLYQKAQLPDSLFEASEAVLQTLHSLDAEQPSNRMRKFKPKVIIDRMKIMLADRKIDNLDFMISIMEQNA